MSRKTTGEKLENAQEQIKKWQAEERKYRQQLNAENRKKRNHILIQLGVQAESILGRTLETEDIGRLNSFLKMQERNGNYFSKAMNKSAGSSESIGE